MKNETNKKCPVYQWIPDSLSCEVRAVIDRQAQTEDVQHIAIMPDVHLANEVCIGTVIATQSLLLPGAIGSDIGCGMAAIQMLAGEELFKNSHNAERMLKELQKNIPTIRHCRNQTISPPEFPDHARLSCPELEKNYDRDGKLEFATIGSGNHFIEVQIDEPGNLWLMVHSGSRGMGNLIQSHHLKNAWKTKSGFHALDAQTFEGKSFLQDVHWALFYAQANRRALIQEVCRIFQELFAVESCPESFRDCHHNSVGRETHFGKDLWVHRKGAVSAHKGNPGIIPGSMGTASYLTIGRGCPEALCSSSHGAGRALSRAEARKRIPQSAFQKSMEHVWFERRFISKLLDEAPQAYKDIQAVMRAQRDLVKIETRLRPLLNFKGVI